MLCFFFDCWLLLMKDWVMPLLYNYMDYYRNYDCLVYLRNKHLYYIVLYTRTHSLTQVLIVQNYFTFKGRGPISKLCQCFDTVVLPGNCCSVMLAVKHATLGSSRIRRISCRFWSWTPYKVDSDCTERRTGSLIGRWMSRPLSQRYTALLQYLRTTEPRNRHG